MAGAISWIKAMRLRTLPLAMSSTLGGTFMAVGDKRYNALVIGLAILTTLLLQILSNLANDLGDSLKGTDNVNRLGPRRTVQGGEITVREMKSALIIVSGLTLISGIVLILSSLGLDSWLVIVFLILGMISIAAALKYTLGERAYGYKGFGDLFVFLFFGLTGVLGTYYLNAHQLPPDTFLMAASVGLLSAGVLNLNNMRDIKNDRLSGKNTIAVIMGPKKAKIYHMIMIIGGLLCGVIYTLLNYGSPLQFIYVLVFPVFIYDLVRIMKNHEPRKLDPFLKKLAIATFVYILLFGLGIILS
ncbi:MAG: 1,4-dihydroxy-2-naphthoate octaprenyltransferase [Bacteroidota bacterium]|nr:1,4-dihydroxy-2-naphthoate octaprenyltransferase [Bacteroidota bacterium]